MAPATSKKRSFAIVYLPADVTQPLEDWQITYTDEDEVDCLFKRIKLHFAKSKPERTPEQLQAYKSQLLKTVPEEQRKALTDDLLAMATDLNMVENIALLANAPDNQFVGVNMYCADDAGSYDAPTNMRASQICQRSGKPLDVKGDAFLARVFDDGQDGFERRDLTTAEVSSSAPWMAAAAVQNARKQRDSAAAAQQPAAAGSPVPKEPAEQAKDRGNAAFKLGKFQEAASCYSEAISIAPAVSSTVLSAYNNRAMCHLKMGLHQEATSDCDKVLQHEPSNVKALLRRATARRALGQHDHARSDYQAVLSLQTSNKEAETGLASLS